MKTNPPPGELRNLIDRQLDLGNLSRTEMARLEDLLDDDTNLAYYLEVTEQEALLPGVLAQTPSAAAVIKPGFRLPAPVLIAAAACVIFMLGWLAGGNRASLTTGAAKADPVVPPARITGMMGVQWTSAKLPYLIGTSGSSDAISIRSGLVEITYGSGVRVTLEGPADFDITDTVSGHLNHGKLVAAVPKGAEGFRVQYRDGAVVDLGTEFAMDVKADGPAEVGVFDGEIELRRDGEKAVPLFENHAVIHDTRDEADPLQAVPFDREKYVRRMPSREFAWEVKSPEPHEVEFDVSHLIWKPSEYRAVFKWINGLDGVVIRNVELRLDGRRIAADAHTGQTGVLEKTSDNLFRLDVDPAKFRSGHWTIHATLEMMPRTDGLLGDPSPVRSLGNLQFEEGLVSRAGEKDFIGRWSYRFLGNSFVREFHADGRVTLLQDDQPAPTSFVGSRWTVKDGILSVDIPNLNAVENHVLRDANTLIFMGRPFENATRMSP